MKQHAKLKFLESENSKQIPKGHYVRVLQAISA